MPPKVKIKKCKKVERKGKKYIYKTRKGNQGTGKAGMPTLILMVGHQVFGRTGLGVVDGDGVGGVHGACGGGDDGQ